MSAKIWIAIAIFLVIFGLAAFGWAMWKLGWDFTKLNFSKYETNTYEIYEDFSDISIKTSSADIVFLPSDDDKCKVVCFERQNVKHLVYAADGVLTLNVVDTRAWYEYIGINFISEKISVYLPRAEYDSLVIKESTGDINIPNDFQFDSIDISVSTGVVKCSASALGAVKIESSTGDVCVRGISAGSLDISVSTADVTASDISCDGEVKVETSSGDAGLKNITCKNLISDGDSGDISLENVIASQRFIIERDTGDVRLRASDAAEIFIETDTGDVCGTLLSGKVFIVDTDTGEKEVPGTASGGRCEISTDTGDVRISIAP